MTPDGPMDRKLKKPRYKFSNTTNWKISYRRVGKIQGRIASHWDPNSGSRPGVNPWVEGQKYGPAMLIHSCDLNKC